MTAILTGAAAGLLGALCGVGGGIVMVPAFVTIRGFEQKQAVATSLAVIIVTSVMGTLNNSLRSPGLIDWKLVLLTAAGAALAAWFGSDLMRALSNAVLTKVFGIFLLAMGLRMLLAKA